MKSGRRKGFGIGFWCAFVLACILTSVFEEFMTSRVESGHASSPLLRTVFDLDTVYHRLVTAGPRAVIPRFTTLIEIREGIEPSSVSLVNVCGQRAFIARVVDTLRLGSRQPSVIVIDKFFGPDSCSAEDLGTQALTAALRAALDSGIGVVTGRTLLAASDGSIAAEPALDFGLTNEPRYRNAVVNIRDDVRAVPLSWTFATAQGPMNAPTISLAAASLYRARFVDDSRVLGRYVESGDPLRVSFLAPGQFAARRFSAMLIVCGEQPPAEWSACPPPAALPEAIGGSIVLIGEHYRDYDVHSTPVGEVPGYLLQASYIEALLDDRYFSVVPQWFNWLIGLVIATAFEFFFVRYHSAFSILWRAACLFGVALIAAYVLVAVTGYLIAPVTVSVLAIALRVLSLAGRPFERH